MRLDKYYYIEEGSTHSDTWLNDHPDRSYFRIFNVFETEEQVNNHLRALELIETIRRERYRAQGHWWPREHMARFSICGQQFGNGVDIDYTSWLLSASVFGLWQDSGVLIDVIEKYELELEWYFTEYLPSIN